MTAKSMTAKSPKDLLIEQDLIGFTPGRKGEGQMPRRASSAKVTVEPTQPARSADPQGSEDKSGA